MGDYEAWTPVCVESSLGYHPCSTGILTIGLESGLGTMIASMASLISFKYISREDASLRGKYFIWFTAANVILLVILLAAAKILGQL